MAVADTSQEVLARAVEMAHGAGEILDSNYGELRRADADRKQGRRDLVSEADRQAEAFLVGHIPDSDDLLSEEGSARDAGAARQWVVDPLDGTVNFLHGIPFWAVSIAVLEAGRLSVAVVHAPALRQTFTARAGSGCFLNEQRVGVSSTGDIGEAILATGFAYERNRLPDNNLDNWTRMALDAAGVRRLGSAALDLSYTACGRFDGFWELHLNAWDVAAGSLLVREAGGRVSDFHGSEGVDRILYARHIVASNGRIHEAIRERLAPLRGLD